MNVRALFQHALTLSPPEVEGGAVALWFSPDGGAVVANGAHASAMYAVPSGALIAEGAAVPRGPHACTRAGGRVALGGSSLRVLDLSTGETWLSLDARDLGTLTDIALSPDATLAAAITAGETCVVFSLPDGARRYTLGGYVSRDRWSRSTDVRGARFSPDGKRLLTFGAAHEASWGIATHHGDRDESNDYEDFVSVYDALTGERLVEEAETRSRRDERGYSAEWLAGDDAILIDRDRTSFRVVTPDFKDRTLQWCDEEFRALYATPDGQRVIAVEPGGTATLFTQCGGDWLKERREGEADPFNGFGLAACLGEPPPRYRVLATPDGALVESWPERVTVAFMRGAFHRIAVRPGSFGGSFATLAEDALTLWEIE